MVNYYQEEPTRYVLVLCFAKLFTMSASFFCHCFHSMNRNLFRATINMSLNATWFTFFQAFGLERLNTSSASVLFDLGMGTGKILIQAFLQFKNLRYIFGIELSAGRYK